MTIFVNSECDIYAWAERDYTCMDRVDGQNMTIGGWTNHEHWQIGRMWLFMCQQWLLVELKYKCYICIALKDRM